MVHHDKDSCTAQNPRVSVIKVTGLSFTNCYICFFLYFYIYSCYLQRTAEEWRNVFFLCFALAILGAILFAVFADGELQSWAAAPAAVEVIEYIKEKDVRSENPELDASKSTEKS